VRIMRAYSRSGWRRILGCLLVYAIALQGLVFAVDAGRSAIATVPDTTFAGFPLCSHGDDGAPAPTSPQDPATCEHCILCLTGVVYVSSTPPATPFLGTLKISNAAWPDAAPQLVTLLGNRSAWPRGPPTAV
jgi:hypothetical protein